MNLDEVVGEVIQGHGCHVILSFAGKAVAKARVAAHPSSYTPILSFDVASRDMLALWVAGHMADFSADTTCGRIARLVLLRRTINLLQYRVVHFHAEGVLNRF